MLPTWRTYYELHKERSAKLQKKNLSISNEILFRKEVLSIKSLSMRITVVTNGKFQYLPQLFSMLLEDATAVTIIMTIPVMLAILPTSFQNTVELHSNCVCVQGGRGKNERQHRDPTK